MTPDGLSVNLHDCPNPSLKNLNAFEVDRISLLDNNFKISALLIHQIVCFKGLQNQNSDFSLIRLGDTGS